MRMPAPLAVGVSGGHGPVRYRVVEHEPGRRVRFEFHPGFGDGHHEMSVSQAGPGRVVLRHELVVAPRGVMRLAWPLAVRWLHDAVLEDLLDNAERELTGQVATPARWSWWVRVLRRFEFPGPRKGRVPADADLVSSALDRVDRQDAWSVELEPGMPTDPQAWADAVFRSPPRWVQALLRLRNAVVRVVGIEPGDPSVFDTLARSEREVLLGADDGHLDFRGSVLVSVGVVTLSTVVRINNRRGRLYMLVVWPIHGRVVRSMLRRAHRDLAMSRRNEAGPAAA
jgi:hypothetical protein